MDSVADDAVADAEFASGVLVAGAAVDAQRIKLLVDGGEGTDGLVDLGTDLGRLDLGVGAGGADRIRVQRVVRSSAFAAGRVEGRVARCQQQPRQERPVDRRDRADAPPRGDEHLLGDVLGGVAIAVIETMAGGYLDFVGSELAQTTALATIIVILLVRPTGLFGSRKVQRV